MRSGLAESKSKNSRVSIPYPSIWMGMIASSTKLSREKYELKESGGLLPQ